VAVNDSAFTGSVPEENVPAFVSKAEAEIKITNADLSMFCFKVSIVFIIFCLRVRFYFF
jgi:hypothetical protein